MSRPPATRGTAVVITMTTLINGVCFLSEALEEIAVVVKALGMGFHLPADGIRSLALVGDEEEGDERDGGDLVTSWSSVVRRTFRSSTPRI